MGRDGWGSAICGLVDLRVGRGGLPTGSWSQLLKLETLAAVTTVVLTGTLGSALPARDLTACCTASLPSSLGSWATSQFKVPALTAEMPSAVPSKAQSFTTLPALAPSALMAPRAISSFSAKMPTTLGFACIRLVVTSKPWVRSKFAVCLATEQLAELGSRLLATSDVVRRDEGCDFGAVHGSVDGDDRDLRGVQNLHGRRGTIGVYRVQDDGLDVVGLGVCELVGLRRRVVLRVNDVEGDALGSSLRYGAVLHGDEERVVQRREGERELLRAG